MARYNAVFNDADSFIKNLGKFNPRVTKIVNVNEASAVDQFGRFNDTALTFLSSPSLLSKDTKVNRVFKDKRQTFFVSKNYKCVPYDEIASTVVDTVKEGYGYSPESVYAQFNPGRIQFLLNYGNQIDVDIESLKLVPFEKSIKNPSLLDYNVNARTNGGAKEGMKASIYADIGFNGKTGIIIYPAWVRMICSNLMISMSRLIKTNTIKHLGKKILDQITTELDESMSFITGQYAKAVEYAVFLKWIESFYGKKAADYLVDLEFRDEVKKNFKMYYAIQVVTLLNRGIEGTSIKGFGLGPKTATAFKHVERLAA